ncbi:OPT oligopeptide transporter protein-domain-containing protein [Naematelia encephala]|uniref:OPT oligopeptide transporter protein-domain-containing protein n=1 Tax=Naematelia encephala TaxID=71784 RepID=A0A1Y2AWM0_9TREE|nr:OPT oligopeptide transporter protein-domain-containing protein [Naematelia encephala]
MSIRHRVNVPAEDENIALATVPKLGDESVSTDNKYDDNIDDKGIDGHDVTVSHAVKEVSDSEDVEAIVIEGADEIAAEIVDTRDDPSQPVLTFRFWFLGAGLAAFGAVLAEIYYWKPQGATVSALFQLVIAYVLGRAMAMLPSHGWWRFINPGPFNIKEHTAIVIFSSTASTTAEAVSIVAILKMYYNLDLNPGIAIIQTWATQCIGYSICGVLQSSLIYPTYALWPANLPTISLLQSMHYGGMLNKKRMRFFWIVFAAIFCWEIIPTWMFPLLTAFSVVCLADHGRHDFVRNLFGAGSSNEGLGLFSFGFDWLLITQAYPLYWPLQTQISSWIGMLVCYILMTGAYYSDVGQGKSNGLPFMSTSLFTSNGSSYDQTMILDSNNRLNQTAYEEYGRPFYTSTYQMSLTTHNLSCGAAVTHMILWHYKDIIAGWAGLRLGYKNDNIDDPHYEKMRAYKVVPHWAYGLVFIASMSISMGTAYYGGTNTIPAWSVLLFSVIGYFFAVVIGFLQATTGFQTSVNGIIQIIAAFIHPGKPIANMYASLYGYYAPMQTLYMLSDQKLGQYAKVPPIATFIAQFAGTILGAVLQYVLYKSIVDAHLEVLLDPLGTRVWAGWNVQGTNSKAVTFGALGKELYLSGKPYWFIPAALGIGLVLPIPFWLMHRRFPKQRFWSYINVPIVTNYMGWLPYSVNGMWWPGAVIGFISQYWARKYRPRWFIKYNYLLSAALDGGTQIIYFILNFAVFGASGNTVDFPYWWGNPDPSLLSVDRCKVPE